MENGTTTAPMRAAASIADDERRAVRVEQSDVSALAGAEGDQAAGQLRRPAVGLGVTEAFGVATRSGCSPRDAACSRSNVADGGLQACSTASAKNRRDGAQVGLARWRSGDLLDDRDIGGNFVARQPCSQEVHERRQRRRSSSRSSTIATGVSPRRSSGRPTTAAPCTAGMAFQRGAHIVGHHLEPAADDRLVGAAEDPEESVGVDAGHVGGADPVRRRARADPV